MQLSHFLFVTTACLAFSVLWSTYSAFFLSTEKFSDTTESNTLDKDNNSWFPQTNKVFMLVIDGLRFDYLEYNETTLGHEQYAYQNRFKKLYGKVAECPECFTLLRTHADAPTFTKDRVPTLVTGNISPKPTMFESYAASKTIEDTVLRQMRLAGKKTYYVGDPVWVELFPDDISIAGLIRAFDIKDTDVDAGVMETVTELLKKNDFDLMIAHTLKIDHISHVFGIYDPKMGPQIEQADQQIANFIDLMDDQTTLIILGDHGSSEEGGHGGDSPGETNTAIAAFHKKGFQKYQDKGTTHTMRSTNEIEKQIKQQDLAPTLSMMLGVPIPFSNFGQIINDLYPADVFQGNQDCQGAAFYSKMLKDNHLNTAQVVDYYNFFEKETRLPTEADHKNIVSLSEDAMSAYKDGLAMIEANQQCQEAFAEKVTAAVLKGQNLSNAVYKVVLSTNNHDMVMVINGLISGALTMIAYGLIIQYLYAFGYKKENDEIKHPVKALKNLIVPSAILVGIYLVMWVLSSRFKHFVTTATLVIAVWLVGSLLKKLFNRDFPQQPLQETPMIELEDEKSKQESGYRVSPNLSTGKADLEENIVREEESDTKILVTTNSNIDKTTRKLSLLQNLKTPFFFQNPLVGLTAIGFILGTILTLHKPRVENFCIQFGREHSLLIAPVFLAFRIGRFFPKKILAVLMALAVAVDIYLVQTNNLELDELQLRLTFAALLMGEWVISEISYVVNKLGAKRVWGFIQAACFLVISAYHLANTGDKPSYFAEIGLPRISWGLMICVIVFKKYLGLEGLSTKRNLMLCLAQFLFLIQNSWEAYFFVTTLTVMRVTKAILSKLIKPSNYLYPVIMIQVAYFGWILIGHHDQRPPSSFVAGFVGLTAFNPVLSSAMIFLNVISALILGMMFVTYHNQDIEIQMPEGVEVTLLESDSVPKEPLLKISARVITKRNLILYVLIISIIFFAAIIRCLVWTDYFFWQARIKYAIDGSIYIFFMAWASIALALA